MNIEQLLQLCYRLEGSLRVALEHGDRRALDLVAADKAALDAAFDAMPAPDATEIPAEPADDNQTARIDQIDQIDETDRQTESETAPADAEEAVDEPAYLLDPKLQTVKDQEAEEPQVKPETVAATEAIERGEPAETPLAAEPQMTIADKLADQTPELRLDEALLRKGARNLRKAFTLNDKFRFRRELFGGDDSLFGQTLDDLQDLPDYDEAVAYVRATLGWDMDNPEVQDFMAVVQSHFSAH